MEAQNTGYSCIGSGTEKPTDTDVNIQTDTNTKTNTSTNSNKARAQRDVYLGSKERGHGRPGRREVRGQSVQQAGGQAEEEQDSVIESQSAERSALISLLLSFQYH